jgi:hypothetical protein
MDYENALFDDEVKKASFNKIVVDRRLGTTTTKSTKKRTVNPVYMRMRVTEDSVSVIPHSNDNGFL